MMDPGWSTLPPMRLLYRAFNLTTLIRAGSNAIGVRLGFCHYGGIDQAFCIGSHAMRDDCRAFIMRLSIQYADGKQQDVITSASTGAAHEEQWLGTISRNPIVYTHLYHGEVFDARHIEPGWDEANFTSATTGWTAVQLYRNNTVYEGPNQPGLEMSLHAMPPIGVAERRAPASVTKLELRRHVAVTGHVILAIGELKSVNGGYYSGGHSAPVPNASTAELCREACSDTTCLQATFDASSIAPQMLQTPDGYFLTSNQVLPYSNASTLAECIDACLAMPHCVQITWTQPRAQERCDMYLFATDSKFDSGSGAQGVYSNCSL